MIKHNDYEAFLNSLVENAKYYVQIIKPSREHYKNRKEYYWLVQSFKVLTDFFGIAQVRVVLMALLWAKDAEKISSKDFKKAILFLENFHFAYTAIMSGKANRLDGIYSKIAIRVRKCSSKEQTRKVLESELYDCLKKLVPTEEQFTERFVELCYTKKSTPSNMKCKYALLKLNCYFQKKDTFEDDSSIEHILPESEGGNANNIGNLILLESSLNTEADNKDFADKIPIYKKSNYVWVKQFTTNHHLLEKYVIQDRAKQMASLYYNSFIKTI